MSLTNSGHSPPLRFSPRRRRASTGKPREPGATRALDWTNGSGVAGCAVQTLTVRGRQRLAHCQETTMLKRLHEPSRASTPHCHTDRDKGLTYNVPAADTVPDLRTRRGERPLLHMHRQRRVSHRASGSPCRHLSGPHCSPASAVTEWRRTPVHRVRPPVRERVRDARARQAVP